jgi:glycosyltransferase 2 family protein
LSKLYLFGGLAVVVAVLLLALILWFYIYKDKALAVSAKVLRILPHKLRDKALELLRELIDGLKIFHNMADFLAYVGLGFVVWLSIAFYYWLFFFAFRFPVPFIWVLPYLFLTAVGASIPTPGMAGGYHILSQLALVELLGMDSNLAGGYTIVVHAIQLVLTCLLGYIIIWKEGLSLFQLKKMGEASEQ